MIVRREGGLLSDLLRDLKAFTAKQLLHLIANHPGESRREWMLPLFRQQAMGKAQNKEYSFWRKDSHPIEIWSGPVLEQKIRYIHQNPVEARMVSEAQHYLLSSAHPDGPVALNGYLRLQEGEGMV